MIRGGLMNRAMDRALRFVYKACYVNSPESMAFARTYKPRYCILHIIIFIRVREILDGKPTILYKRN